MIQLTTPNGHPIYIVVVQLAAIRYTAGDAAPGANAWVDLANGRSLATRETPAEILTKLPVELSALSGNKPTS